MKKSLLLIVFTNVISFLSAQQPSIIESVLEYSVKEKVSSMQELIGFDDAQAEKLMLIETEFLFDVNKVEHCFLCNKRKRIEKLKEKRVAQLQEVLDRDQYIKYDAIDNKRIKMVPLRSD